MLSSSDPGCCNAQAASHMQPPLQQLLLQFRVIIGGPLHHVRPVLWRDCCHAGVHALRLPTEVRSNR